ncbi:putative tam domain [Phaeomoniella chlamydospora]|uniref:Putative tam domain n=1 Tax=Phaeomoniella chlamydospora TaxID=158046 RepID=A0A0G2GKV0_PHACM|nr:putative tam domain [Phaeomoniella chlamydospora]
MSESPNDIDSNSPQDATTIPTVLEADPNDSDYDEETESLKPDISDYIKQYGRTYHRYKQGSYPFPNDPRELERLDEQFEIFMLLSEGRLHFSPTLFPTAILDVGTGTGTWAIEMGERYPDATVTGTDLSPCQPFEVPPNVCFEIDDASEDDWARDLGSFDLIHSSMMLGSFESFRKFVRTSYKYLKPDNGWLECWELDPTARCDDNTVRSDSPFQEWEDLLHEAAEEKLDPPRPIRYAHRISSYMRNAGFVDVEELKYKLPINSWPGDPKLKELGRRWGEMMLEGMSGFTYKLLGQEGFGWPRHEIEVRLALVRKSMKDRNQHAYQNLHVVWGRRPSTEQEPRIRRQLEQKKREREARRRTLASLGAAVDSSAHTGPASARS